MQWPEKGSPPTFSARPGQAGLAKGGGDLMKSGALLLVSSLALAIGLASPASAQDESAPPAPAPEAQPEQGQIGEIVVTAQFRSQRLQDTPIAITAVNAAMLEARGQTDISQVAAQAPNVTLKPQGQINGSGLIAYIRGVGQNNFSLALEPGVGIYIDDVYFPTITGSLLDLTDVDRVEVLRGPQGTLAGKNSIGGAIKVFSSKPDGSGKGSIQATYGSFNRVDFRGSADFALADNLFVRIAAVSKNRDGYVTRLDYAATHPGSTVPTLSQGNDAKLGTLGGTSMAAGRLSLRWKATPDIEVNVSGDYTADNSEANASVIRYAKGVSSTPDGRPLLRGTDGNAVPFDCRFVPYGVSSCDTLTGYNRKYVSYATFLDPMEASNQLPFKPLAVDPIQHYHGGGVQGTIDWSLNPDFQLKSITAYRRYVSRWGDDSDGSPIPSQQQFNTLRFHYFSEELRLNGKVADGLADFTVGGFYSDQRGSLDSRVDLNYSGIDFINGPDITPASSKAAFLNVSLHPADGFTLSGGVRYSKDKKDYTYFRTSPDGSIPAPCNFAAPGGPTGNNNAPNCLLAGIYDITGTYSGDRWDYRAVADYRFSPELLVYASIATGYQGGGVNPYPYYGPAQGECSALPPGSKAPCNQLKSFQPQTLTTYETGFKADLFDRRLRFNAAAFFNQFNDIILNLNACPGTPCAQPSNIGSAHVRGLEAEIDARPLPGLSINGSASYLDFKYTDITGPTTVKYGMITPYTPEWTYSFGVQYDHETSIGTLSARFDGSYQSHVYANAVNDDFYDRINGYFVGNARLTWTAPSTDWQVALEIKNVFDKYYYLTLLDQGASSAGQVAAQPGLPRTWAVTLKRSF